MALSGDPARCGQIAAAARRLARPDAAKAIVDRALELVGQARRAG
jgi:UDP-N-acetylglucosamine:LPS N-acetylglucosamine transferase